MRYTINDKEVSWGVWCDSHEDGTHRSYNGNGQLEMEVPYQNHSVHGIAKWYNNGSVVDQKAFICGILRPELLQEEHRLERLVLLGT